MSTTSAEKAMVDTSIDPSVLDVLNEVRVLEFTTVTRDSTLNTRPMSGVRSRTTGQILVTVPIAYPQKAFNVRRDGRVALLYSDFTGSGLPGRPAILVQGNATAPPEIAAPQDIPEYWQEVVRRYPGAAEWYRTEDFRMMMDWYVLRLRILVDPVSIRSAPAVDFGGRWEPPVAEVATMPMRIMDAVERYPTAVLCALDKQGFPFAARARIARGQAGLLRVQPLQPFFGLPGKANVLWHRHDGRGGEMRSLLLTGELRCVGGNWSFLPENMPGEFGSVTDERAWFRDARARAFRYLDKRGLELPMIDWTVFSSNDCD